MAETIDVEGLAGLLFYTHKRCAGWPRNSVVVLYLSDQDAAGDSGERKVVDFVPLDLSDVRSASLRIPELRDRLVASGADVVAFVVVHELDDDKLRVEQLKDARVVTGYLAGVVGSLRVVRTSVGTTEWEDLDTGENGLLSELVATS